MIRTETTLTHICDFCASTEHEVKKIIVGPTIVGFGELCICDECVAICVDILEEGQPGEDMDALRLDAARYRALRSAQTETANHIRVFAVEQPNGRITPADAELCDLGADLLIAKNREKANGL